MVPSRPKVHWFSTNTVHPLHRNPVHVFMKKTLLLVLTGLFLVAAQASAQQQTVTGKVTSEQGTPLPDVTIIVRGTSTHTTSNSDGTYSIRAEPGQILQFRSIGTAPTERPVGTVTVIDIQLRRVAASLDAVVVTALG